MKPIRKLYKSKWYHIKNISSFKRKFALFYIPTIILLLLIVLVIIKLGYISNNRHKTTSKDTLSYLNNDNPPFHNFRWILQENRIVNHKLNEKRTKEDLKIIEAYANELPDDVHAIGDEPISILLRFNEYLETLCDFQDEHQLLYDSILNFISELQQIQGLSFFTFDGRYFNTSVPLSDKSILIRFWFQYNLIDQFTKAVNSFLRIFYIRLKIILEDLKTNKLMNKLYTNLLDMLVLTIKTLLNKVNKTISIKTEESIFIEYLLKDKETLKTFIDLYIHFLFLMIFDVKYNGKETVVTLNNDIFKLENFNKVLENEIINQIRILGEQIDINCKFVFKSFETNNILNFIENNKEKKNYTKCLDILNKLRDYDINE